MLNFKAKFTSDLNEWKVFAQENPYKFMESVFTIPPPHLNSKKLKCFLNLLKIRY